METKQNIIMLREYLYSNTPLQDCKLSPAQILFHRELRDSFPSNPAHYQLHQDWLVRAQNRSNDYAKRNPAIIKEYNRKTRELHPLTPGAYVAIQG